MRYLFGLIWTCTVSNLACTVFNFGGLKKSEKVKIITNELQTSYAIYE